MNDGEDADGAGFLLIENDVRAMLMATNTGCYAVGLSTHLRIRGQQGEDVSQLLEVANGLLPSEAFQSEQIDIEQVSVGAGAGEVISHA